MLRIGHHLCRQTLFLGRPVASRSIWRETADASLRRPLLKSPSLSPSPSPSSSPRSGRRHLTTSRSRLLAERVPEPTQADQPQVTPSLTPPPAPLSSQQPPAQQKRRRARALYLASLFLLLGTAAGTLARITIAPPALPVLGSEQDVYLQEKIQAQGAALPLVQQLSADPAWTSWEAYSGISNTTPPPSSPSLSSDNLPKKTLSAAQSRITSGPLSGSSGLAFQRIFHNASTGEVVTVIYFGAALAGWPGVVHGGALATLLDESLGRCAILSFPARTGVTANLNLSYRAPTLTNNFYVIRAVPVTHDEDGKKSDKSDRKLWVRGSLETEKGKVTVEAKALFVVPKKYQLRPLVEGF